MIFWRQLNKTKPKSNKNVLLRDARGVLPAPYHHSVSYPQRRLAPCPVLKGGGNPLSYGLTGVPPPPLEENLGSETTL